MVIPCEVEHHLFHGPCLFGIDRDAVHELLLLLGPLKIPVPQAIRYLPLTLDDSLDGLLEFPALTAHHGRDLVRRIRGLANGAAEALDPIGLAALQIQIDSILKEVRQSRVIAHTGHDEPVQMKGGQHFGGNPAGLLPLPSTREGSGRGCS